MFKKQSYQTNQNKSHNGKTLSINRSKPLGLQHPNNNKIMLSHLCPQQKMKVGELIKVNESKQQQIIHLTQELRKYQLLFAQGQSALTEWQHKYQLKMEQQQKSVSECRQLQKSLINNEIVCKKMQIQLQNYRKETQIFRSKQKANIITQTDEVNKTDLGIQTKKFKLKSIQIQTQLYDYLQVKGQQREYSQNNTRKQTSSNFQQIQEKKHRQVRKHSVTSRQQSQQALQDQFEDLTRQLMKFKHKNIQKLEAQYNRSMARLQQDREIYDSKPFSFQEAGTQGIQELQLKDIDESQLNTMLKSGNFSASRLLSSKNMLGDSHNSRKRSKDQKEQKVQNSSLRIRSSDKINGNQTQTKVVSVGKNSLRAEQSTQKSHFYDQEFINLLNSMNS